MSNSVIDSPVAVRQGEELNLDALQQYLQAQLGGFTERLEARQFPGGYSNLTYLITSGDKEYVLRRPPFGAKIATAHDMGREYKVLSLLKPIFGQVPQPIIHCEDEAVIGAPFYIMERVKGVILRGKAPEGLTLDTVTIRAVSESTVDLLAQLHGLDIKQHGLDSFGKPEGYIQRQVEGWIKRYKNAQTDDIQNMDIAAEWMLANQPKEVAPAFIHNDYKYDNLVLNPDNLTDIKAVLDWEMATVGDPLMDLGTSLGYWAEPDDHPMLKGFSLTSLPGNYTRQEVVERYQQQTGQNIDNMEFYFAFGSYKIAVICQQIYKRFAQGHTKDPRFGALIHLVRATASNAERAVQLGRISNLNQHQP